MQESPQGPVEIAVIGSGIGGSSAAHFLRQALGDTARITIFERDGRAGGRMRALDIGGLRVEAGASLIHSANKHLVTFAQTLRL